MARPPSRGRRVGRPPGARAGRDPARPRPGFEGFAAAHGFEAPRKDRERPAARDDDRQRTSGRGDDRDWTSPHDDAEPLTDDLLFDARPSGSGAADARGTQAGFDPREFEMPPDPPPGARPRGGHGAAPRGLPDLSLILVVLDAVRAAVPRELQHQFTALLREVLLTVRVLIDRYLERLDGRSSRSQVEDIPID